MNDDSRRIVLTLDLTFEQPVSAASVLDCTVRTLVHSDLPKGTLHAILTGYEPEPTGRWDWLLDDAADPSKETR